MVVDMDKLDDMTAGGRWVKFDDGDNKDLTLLNWRIEEKTIENDVRQLLVFDVEEEDGQNIWNDDAEKRFTLEMGSKRFIKAMRPLIVEAQERGAERIKARIMCVGDGFDRRYSIKKLSIE